MEGLGQQIEEAVSVIRQTWSGAAKAGMILGTGLGGLSDQIEVEATFPYEQIPHFPVSTAPSHKGQLVCGMLSGVSVVTLEGRFHYYEGYSLRRSHVPRSSHEGAWSRHADCHKCSRRYESAVRTG